MTMFRIFTHALGTHSPSLERTILLLQQQLLGDEVVAAPRLENDLIIVCEGEHNTLHPALHENALI